jgi:hypothetical protein
MPRRGFAAIYFLMNDLCFCWGGSQRAYPCNPGCVCSAKVAAYDQESSATRNMLGWTHSGFSVELTLKIPASSSKAREALAQYIARPPVSLQKMLVEEHAGSLCIAQSTIRTSF